MPKRFGNHGGHPAIEGEFNAIWGALDGVIKREGRVRQDATALPGAIASEKKAREETADVAGGEQFLLMGA